MAEERLEECMKVLLLSDSHGRTEKVLSVAERHRDIVCAIHMGDFGTDINVLQEVYPAILTEAVLGNNDPSGSYPVEKVLQLGGKKLFLTHGHTYNAGRSLTPLLTRARQEGAEIAAFGHTHVPLVQQHDGILLVNPGCLFRPRSLHGATYVILDITRTHLQANIFSV